MGASPDKIVGDRLFNGQRWFEMVLGIGDPEQGGPVHRGCVLGRRWGADHTEPERRGEARATLMRILSLVTVAMAVEEGVSSLADFTTLFNTLTYAPPVGPWPGGSPAAWWATLNTEQRMDYVHALVDAALDARFAA